MNKNPAPEMNLVGDAWVAKAAVLRARGKNNTLHDINQAADYLDAAAAMAGTLPEPSPNEPRCPEIGWPPIKKAIWDQIIAANLNGGKYISAWDLTDSIHAAVQIVVSNSENNREA